MIKLGDKVTDIVTGYTGIAVGKTEWLNKCVRIAVQKQELHDGKPVEQQWFDSEQLVVEAEQAVVIKKDQPTGGPRPVETVRRSDPFR